MTAAPTQPYTIDLTGTPRISFVDLVRVELRKSVDTRSGRWLVIITGVLTALIMAVQLVVVVTNDLTVGFESFLQSTTFSMAMLLPVIGILLVTSEWSQRTAMVTFTLEPRRGRVVLAKFVVGLVLAVLAVLVSLVCAAVLNLLYGALSGNEMVWADSVQLLGSFLVAHAIGMVMGFAFATLLLSSPAAIVIFFGYQFVLVPLFQLGTILWDWFADLRPWIDFMDAQTPLLTGDMTGEDWVQLLVSGLIWLGIPLALGVRRILRAEVK